MPGTQKDVKNYFSCPTVCWSRMTTVEILLPDMGQGAPITC